MAATKSQGKNFTLFMAGLTAVCAGIAFFSIGRRPRWRSFSALLL